MFLDEATQHAAQEMKERMKRISSEELTRRIEESPTPPDFVSAISGGESMGMIAEIKKMSPSAGAIRPDLSVEQTAASYQRAGAHAISVLTAGFKFGGSLDDLEGARGSSSLPLLRKDFITDEYQVLEGRAYGASCVLLIAKSLSSKRICQLAGLAKELGMSSLIEVHDRDDLERAMEAEPEIVGINNRNLLTLDVDLETTEELYPSIPANTVVVSESGIRSREDVLRMEKIGVDALLIGEALVRSPNPEEKLKELLGS